MENCLFSAAPVSGAGIENAYHPPAFATVVSAFGGKMQPARCRKIWLVVFLALISPRASMVSQMDIAYNNDAESAGAINVITTLFGIITMPLMVMAYLA